MPPPQPSVGLAEEVGAQTQTNQGGTTVPASVASRIGESASLNPMEAANLDKRASDALQYMQSVSDVFGGQSSTHEHFLRIMRNFMANLVNPYDLYAEVCYLFHEHDNLKKSFTEWLPADVCEEALRQAAERGRVRAEAALAAQAVAPGSDLKNSKAQDALSFVQMVCDRFGQTSQTQQSFLRIMREFSANKVNPYEGYAEVCYLFHDHEDLREGFKQWLPPDVDRTLLARAAVSA